MFIQWSDEKYALGIPGIDMQHQELFVITNQIHDCLNGSREPKNLESLFKRLYAYTKYHFSSEELVFRKYGYPGADNHLAIHNDFTAKIKDMIESYREPPQTPLEELLDFLVNWIVNHIKGEDPRYRDFFKENNCDIDIDFSQVPGGKTIDQKANVLWRDKKLALEISSIDKEHMELVKILQQFNDLQFAREDRIKTFLPVFIERMSAYSEYHFIHEEELMAKYGFEGLPRHKELHRDFIWRVQDFIREFGLEKETLLDEIIYFLKDWAISHILNEDSKYKELIQSRIGNE